MKRFTALERVLPSQKIKESFTYGASLIMILALNLLLLQAFLFGWDVEGTKESVKGLEVATNHKPNRHWNFENN